MAAEQIYREGSLRMWRIWLPIIAVLVVALYFAFPLPNGLWALIMILFAGVCIGAVVDWVQVELQAHKALRAA
ncbi:hypothetical protein [Arthrobacter sp. JUb115]|uniref:hypothetical protein n=1 Tax=Arthrobacter sp. JUb115 TaxID=2485108 RepID=UPI00105DFD58|nr:hypothetical protein [Arthrobacter sp. JUb115]TDU27069.1 hypothetical protein EDF61_104145 [Arthrobacter sp. JUb115]